MINFWNGNPINACASLANTVADGQQILWRHMEEEDAGVSLSK